VRLIAYALFYHEQLAFGRGLSDVDEPALWEKSLDDRVLHWIEVGQPEDKPLAKACSKADAVIVYCVHSATLVNPCS
jgi:uncharacterized protein YaeQ